MEQQKRSLPRRGFLKSAGAVAGAALGFPHIVPSTVFAQAGRPGANERITTAHIGLGGMGNGHLGAMLGRMKRGEVNVAAVCDADEKRLADASKRAGPQADVYRDYRYILERKDIDAVMIATPDHWHAVQMVHAAQCGKHVYVEKPACCTIEEGKAMVAAARENKIATQIGSQGRSQPEAYLAHRYLVNGAVGKVSHVECFHYPSPSDDRPVADSDPPADLDWDLWLGPLPWRPYNQRYCHGTFRWILESGGGQIRDRGAHVFSCAMWWMGADGTGPVTVEATGTSPRKGLWDSAMNMEVKYTFKDPDWLLTWTQAPNAGPRGEKRNQGEDKITRDGYGAIYHGDKGTMTHWGGDGGTWAERKVREWEPPAGFKDVYNGRHRGETGHHENWFEGIRTGKKTVMNVEAAVGVSNLCVLANLSFILGRPLNWDHAKSEILGDEEARRMMSRPQRYPYVL